jgi:carbon storage regulator CsrA
MWVMTRKAGESIVIGFQGEITVNVIEIRGDRVRLAVDAPRERVSPRPAEPEEVADRPASDKERDQVR